MKSFVYFSELRHRVGNVVYLLVNSRWISVLLYCLSDVKGKSNVMCYCVKKKKSCAVLFLPFSGYLCDHLVKLESVQLKQSPSSPRSLRCLISPPKPAAQCLLTCTGTFTTNRWLASEGKQMADLIRNQCCCLMGKITGRWGQLGNNGPVQGLKSRWLLTDGSLRVQEESNQVGEEDGSVGGRWEEGSAMVATRQMKVRHDVRLTQRTHPHSLWP